MKSGATEQLDLDIPRVQRERMLNRRKIQHFSKNATLPYIHSKTIESKPKVHIPRTPKHIIQTLRRSGERDLNVITPAPVISASPKNKLFAGLFRPKKKAEPETPKK